MFFLRLRIILLSIIILLGFGAFLLYKLDLYVKNQAISILYSQVASASSTTFESSSILSYGIAHNYSMLDTIKKQPSFKDMWISRNDILSKELSKANSSLKDVIERKVYITKQNESSLDKADDKNNHKARISVPILITNSCITCHKSLKAGDVAGSVNVEYLLNDSVFAIYDTMKFELGAIVLVAALFFMFVMLLSIRSFTGIVDNIKVAIQSAINGDFSIRVKNRGLNVFNETTKIVNRFLEILDKSISSIDVKIASIFIYNKSLYSKNPLMRTTELIAEITNLFLFKNKIESVRQNRDIYRELQMIISRYIKYKYLVFAEIIDGAIVSGYKIEDNIEMKIVVGDVKAIEKRLGEKNHNILFDDNKGCLFISTSIEHLNVIDLRIVVSADITLYYSIVMQSKKDLMDKEKSVSRIYNYIREASPLIKNIILLKNIEESSYSDPLTKAYNRLYLEKYSNEVEIKLAKHINFGVLMIDIDHFKKVNDTYGHAVGDAGIVMLVETIRACIKPVDKLFRYGGEEFVVILEGYDINEANRMAEKIRGSFAAAKKCSLMEINFPKSVSIGMSAMPDFSRNIWDCINQADLALYQAKASGRNKVVKYSLELEQKDKMRKQQEASETPKQQKQTKENIISPIEDDDASFLESLKLNNME